jgi:Ca2+-binding EF-hand superfamily protein
MKYKVAFANYDTDHDGYLMNDQARDILLQTRLDPSDLMAIWELADRPPVH